MSETKQSPESWSAESKLMAIIESSALSELELGEYCRRKGIFPEQIDGWRKAFITNSNNHSALKKGSPGSQRKTRVGFESWSVNCVVRTRRWLKRSLC